MRRRSEEEAATTSLPRGGEELLGKHVCTGGKWQASDGSPGAAMSRSSGSGISNSTASSLPESTLYGGGAEKEASYA
ncbi:hypothetical protein [Paenibacillus sp. 1P07SE]|uniref:hypothetical protein n=1 Tax=Paenibacillus sp. 1P07SE TaxID=3132209 RepID=UPI0039A4F424